MGKVFEALRRAEKEAERHSNRSNLRKDEESSATEDTISGLIPTEETDAKNTEGPLKNKPIPADSDSEEETRQSEVWRALNPEINDAPLRDEKKSQKTNKSVLDKVNLRAVNTTYAPALVNNEAVPSSSDNQSANVRQNIDISKELRLIRKEFSNQNMKKIKVKRNRRIKKRKKDLITLHHPNSIISENFKMIRTRLLQSIMSKDVRTILVTSSLPGEGKSFVAANIAVSIAKGFEQHVLLVDSDSYKLSLQHIFDINPDVGLCDYIANEEHELSHLIKRTPVPKLSILTAGSCYENSSELMASKVMTLLLQEFKYRYDDRYIIFDAPPATRSQSLALADKVDGIIIVVKAGETDRKLVNKTIEMVGRKRVVGIIMNYCDVGLNNYAGYYGKNGY